MLAVGDSLLQGTEATICWSDLLSRDVCCLPGICIQDAVERLPRFIWLSPAALPCGHQ